MVYAVANADVPTVVEATFVAPLREGVSNRAALPREPSVAITALSVSVVVVDVIVVARAVLVLVASKKLVWSRPLNDMAATLQVAALAMVATTSPVPVPGADKIHAELLTDEPDVTSLTFVRLVPFHVTDDAETAEDARTCTTSPGSLPEIVKLDSVLVRLHVPEVPCALLSSVIAAYVSRGYTNVTSDMIATIARNRFIYFILIFSYIR